MIGFGSKISSGSFVNFISKLFITFSLESIFSTETSQKVFALVVKLTRNFPKLSNVSEENMVEITFRNFYLSPSPTNRDVSAQTNFFESSHENKFERRDKLNPCEVMFLFSIILLILTIS